MESKPNKHTVLGTTLNALCVAAPIAMAAFPPTAIGMAGVAGLCVAAGFLAHIASQQGTDAAGLESTRKRDSDALENRHLIRLAAMTVHQIALAEAAKPGLDNRCAKALRDLPIARIEYHWELAAVNLADGTAGKCHLDDTTLIEMVAAHKLEPGSATNNQARYWRIYVERLLGEPEVAVATLADALTYDFPAVFQSLATKAADSDPMIFATILLHLHAETRATLTALGDQLTDVQEDVQNILEKIETVTSELTDRPGFNFPLFIASLSDLPQLERDISDLCEHHDYAYADLRTAIGDYATKLDDIHLNTLALLNGQANDHATLGHEVTYLSADITTLLAGQTAERKTQGDTRELLERHSKQFEEFIAAQNERLEAVRKAAEDGAEHGGERGAERGVEKAFNQHLPRLVEDISAGVHDQLLSSHQTKPLKEWMASGEVRTSFLLAHNPHFEGRMEELASLHESVSTHSGSAISIIHGIGGLGKSSLATEYAHRHREDFSGGRWFLEFQHGRTFAANLVNYEGTICPTLDLLSDEQKRGSTEEVAAAILLKLRHIACLACELPEETDPSKVPPVLVILDDVDETDVLASKTFRSLLQNCPWLHIVATMRPVPRNLVRSHEYIPMGVLDEASAISLIENYGDELAPSWSEEDHSAIREIVRLLEGFTLAIEIAAAYLAERGDSLTAVQLRDYLRKGKTDDFALEVESELDHGEKLVALTFRSTWEYLSRKKEERAQLLLAIASQLPADNIATTWLQDLANAFPFPYSSEKLSIGDPWRDAIATLLRLRILKHGDDIDQLRNSPQIVRIHRVLQSVIRDLFAEGSQYLARELNEHIYAHAKRRVEFLIKNWTDPTALWEIPIATAYASHAMGGNSRAVCQLANKLVKILIMRGEYANATPLAEAAKSFGERVLGTDHPDTLTSVNNLAELLKYTGDYVAAEPLYRIAIDGSMRVLGADHPDTLVSVNNLAALLEGMGNYRAAEPLFRQVLEISGRVLGEDHLFTLGCTNNLAVLMKKLGDYEAAEKLYLHALQGYWQVLGESHLFTLKIVNNLASLLENRGDYNKAELMGRIALEGFERMLGSDHPTTLSSLSNFATLLHAKGDYGAAQPLYSQALERRTRILGSEHPDTLSSLDNLACLLQNKGDGGTAEPMFRKALEGRKRVLGQDHPDTLATINNLAHLLEKKGNDDAAELMFRRSIEGNERVLGVDHPSTLGSLNNLAALLKRKKDFKAAEPMYRRALEGCERVLGEGHPTTLVCGYNLAKLYEETGDDDAAELLLHRTVVGLFNLSEKMAGLHPNLIQAIQNYAGCLLVQGKSEAELQTIIDGIAERHGFYFRPSVEGV